jgi:alpha-N-arabinofuranosidase
MVEQAHQLLRFARREATHQNLLTIHPGEVGPKVPRSILGNFLEHLSCSTLGGVSAETLCNPTFSRVHNLTQSQIDEFTANGRLMVEYYLSGDPVPMRHRWVSTPLATGFGVAILDNATDVGLPLGWSAMGYPGSVGASVGRLGGAVRLRGGQWPEDLDPRWMAADDGPAGLRQGVFVPIARVLGYVGNLWVRIASSDVSARGVLEIGFRRRVATPDGVRRAGEVLASARMTVQGGEWQQLGARLELSEGAVDKGEPVDVYLRWMPRSDPKLDLLVDRASVMPEDAIDGLDPDLVGFVRKSIVAHLRWPGGNFVSYYHWRDGVGPIDRRPTYPNNAWGGLEYNLIGTDEYIRFCRLVNADTYITVNSGTGTPEEAADWVEYCNGPPTSPMGSLRARNGHPEAYNVRTWEVGNENFGSWQGGHAGSEENARRFSEFATLMRRASPIPIELIACGNGFDFAQPGPAYDHVTADSRWHDRLLEAAPDDIDYISLHSLPVNDHLLEAVTDQQAHEAVLAQVVTWERRFLPDLLQRCDGARRAQERPPIRISMSEWGGLGMHPARLMVENFGGVVYAGTFLNFMIRNSDRIPLASPNGFMHGGCIRKAQGIIYADPMVDAMQQYADFVGTTPVLCELEGTAYDVSTPADLGAVDVDIPYLDAVACLTDTGGYLIAVANRHLVDAMPLVIRLPDSVPESADIAVLSYHEITARTTPAEPDRFPVSNTRVSVSHQLTLSVPPFSVAWIRL